MRYYVLLVLVICFLGNIKSQDMKMVYVGDPMCSWCYGISNEVNEVLKHYNGALEMELYVGGLRNGGGDKWNTEFKDFLKHHWEDVQAKSGQPFKFDLLKQDAFDYDTEPACRSMVVVKSMDNSKVWPFFKAVQSKFYFDNQDPKDVAFYESICSDLSLDFKLFRDKFNDEATKLKTQSEFQYVQKIGARSFPTIYILKDDQLIMIAKGYATKAAMVERIESIF